MKKVLIGLMIVTSLNFVGCGSKSNNTKDSASTTQQTQQQTQTNQVEYFFPKANQHPAEELIKVINSSKSNLDIAIYSITKKDIVDSIVAAKNKGVNVRIITDKQESNSKAQKQMLAILKNAGIPIKVNSHKGLMHLKVTIADKSIVTTGSYNYTNEASFNNDEVLVVIHDQKTAQDFTNQFERMWNDTANFKDF